MARLAGEEPVIGKSPALLRIFLYPACKPVHRVTRTMIACIAVHTGKRRSRRCEVAAPKQDTPEAGPSLIGSCPDAARDCQLSVLVMAGYD